MASPANALQAGIYTRLTAQLTPTPVYDHVPQNSTYPYVVIGEDTAVDWSTKNANGWETTLTIHVWDRPKAGRKSVKTLQSNIYDALHRQESNVTVTGFQLVTLQCEFETSFQETAVEGSNDHYYHGVQRFRATIRGS